MIASLFVPFAVSMPVLSYSSSSVRVETNVSGDANVDVNITSEVNGKRNTVTSKESGTIILKQSDDSSQITINGQPITPSANPTKIPIIGDTKSTVSRYYLPDLVKHIATSIRNFCISLLDNL